MSTSNDGLIEFVQGRKATIKNMRIFCLLAYKELLREVSLPEKQKLRLYLGPSSTNGYVRLISKKQKQQFCIAINLSAFLHSRRECGDLMCYFYAFTTLLHELQHIQLSYLLYSEEVPETASFIAALQQAFPQKKSKFFRIITAINRQRRTASLEELVCTRAALRGAFSVFDDVLSHQQRKTIQQMVDCIHFACEHIEVGYLSYNRAYNRFIVLVHRILQQIRRGPKLTEQMKLLKHIFECRGGLRSPHQLFQDAKKGNRDFYNDMLVQLFVSFDLGWQTLFALHPELKEYMGLCANAYCKKCINYLKNIHKGELFLSQQVLQDNAALLIWKTERLNQLMERFDIPRTEGSVIALYRV